MANSGANVGQQKTPLIVFPGVADPSRWPKADSGKCCLFEAVNIVGAAMFGDRWVGSELLVLKWSLSPTVAAQAKLVSPPPPPPSPLRSPRRLPVQTSPADDADSHDIVSRLLKAKADAAENLRQEQDRWEQNKLATERLTRAVEWLAQQCRDGALTSYWRLTTGGIVSPMSASDWNVDDPLSAFLPQGGYERWLQWTGGPFKSWVYIFLERKALAVAISAFAHAPAQVQTRDLAQLSPMLQLAVKLALQNRYFSPEQHETEDIRKAEVEAAWEKAMPDVPISRTAVQAIAKVMAFPDAKAIRHGQSALNVRKKGVARKPQ